ncbi:MAG: SMP-30/gluconolactonase/LRE family protein [Gammaproteobacteria bacterium]|nr:SMP-30/gluconolactonase/LRE family protein [Gammaproteobacteria bacterium]MBQ0839625.1 SMP-30/gluconolactonase/LRE family protein [Gammaproteobacteria bacterium]
MKLIIIMTCAMLLVSCSSNEAGTKDCLPKGDITPVCKFKNPEDAVVLANGQVIVSQMGNLEEKSPGSLALFDVETGSVTTLFGHGYSPDYYLEGSLEGSPNEPADNSWGNVDCEGEPSEFISPHGISLLKRADERLQLMVVNHGRRESVEFFEVVMGEQGVSTLWRGCVLAPNKEFFNDVAALPDGGFIVSSMYATKGPKLLGLHFGGYKALLGMDSGYLSEWHPWQEMTVVRGSHGAFPNGLALSKDGRYIYENLYGTDEVRKLDRRSGEVLAVAPVIKPDNSTIDAKGRLLVASQKVSLLELNSCLGKPDESCLLPFEIIQIDPQTMASKVVLHQEGPPMGTGTVAVQYKDQLLIGSFLGDRMILTPYSD